jgi:chromosome partitioning protein
MSIITIATTKGGAGKTTLARLILGRLAPTGLRLAAIDADFNRTLTDWITSIAKYPVSVRHELDDDRIEPLANQLHLEHDIVVIDPAGAASHAAMFAMSVSDLVIIPLQPSMADLVEAIKTFKMVNLLRRQVVARAILVSTQPTNITEHVELQVRKAGLPLMQTKITRLVAFQEMSFTGIVPSSGVAGGQVTDLINEISDLIPLPQPERLAS